VVPELPKDRAGAKDIPERPAVGKLAVPVGFRYEVCFTDGGLVEPNFNKETEMDILIIIAILLIIFGGVGTAVGFLADLIWILIVLGVILLLFRLVSGRRV
jgi:hypothetical protein